MIKVGILLINGMLKEHSTPNRELIPPSQIKTVKEVEENTTSYANPKYRRKNTNRDTLLGDVETEITGAAVAQDGVDTVLGDAQLRSPLVELRRGGEIPETLGDEGECRVVASGHASDDVNGEVVGE